MPYATGIVSSIGHSSLWTDRYCFNGSKLVFHKVIDKPNIDQKEILEATAQYREVIDT